MNEKQRAFIEERHMGVLGTVNPDGSPHLTVMWYAVDGDEIMFNTVRGRAKPRNLERDPRVSLLVLDAYRFVRVSGRAHETATGEQALQDIHALAVRYNGPESAERAMERFRAEQRVSYRFEIAKVYSSADLK